MRRERVALVLVCALGLASAAQAADPGWPGFRGPNFDGAVRGASLPEGDALSLAVAWSVPLGPGYSALAVGDGRVAAMFASGDGDFLGAFDMKSGAELWRYRIADTYKGHDGSHDGPIATPVMDGGKIFGLGPRGQLFAVDAATGKQVWAKSLIDDFGAEKPWYGFSSSPRVVDGVLVVELSQIPEEKKEPKPMAVAGLDAATGKTLWIVGDDHIEYQSPVVATLGGQRQLLVSGKTNLYGLEAKTGKVLWSYKHDGDGRAMGGLSIVPVPVEDDRVFLMHKQDSSVMLRVVRKGSDWEVSQVWSGGALKQSYVRPVYHDGYLYGMNNRVFTCMSAETGEAAWRSREPGDGFPTLIGDKLVVITKPGSLHVIDATPEGYHERAKLDLFQEHSWSEVAYADGHLFARSMGHLARIDPNRAGTLAAASMPAWLADTVLGRFLVKLDQAPDKSAAIDAFLAEHPESPIVGDDGTAHFLYRGPAQDVGIVGDMIGFRREDPMTHVPGTDLFHYSTRLEPDAAVTYGFIVDYGKPAADPRNPRSAKGLFGDTSWFSMPAWPGAELARAEAPARAGRIETFEWASAKYDGKTRKAEVYLPAGYDGSDRRYPVAYVHFGKRALEQGGSKEALDRLIGTQVAPLIAVFIHHYDEQEPRGEARDEHYAEMVVEELVPAIDAKYRTIADPWARASVGAGNIGGTAVALAFEHPDLFRRAAAQSPLMGPDEIKDLNERGADVRPLVLYVDWGTYHMRSPHEAWSLVDSSRDLWAALRTAGYRPAGGERPEGFGWPIWAAHAGEMWGALFPL